MATPCPFKVKKRIRSGPMKGQTTIAQFADLADAANFAWSCSSGRWMEKSNVHVVVYGADGRVKMRLCRGVRL